MIDIQVVGKMDRSEYAKLIKITAEYNRTNVSAIKKLQEKRFEWYDELQYNRDGTCYADFAFGPRRVLEDTPPWV